MDIPFLFFVTVIFSAVYIIHSTLNSLFGFSDNNCKCEVRYEEPPF